MLIKSIIMYLELIKTLKYISLLIWHLIVNKDYNVCTNLNNIQLFESWLNVKTYKIMNLYFTDIKVIILI